MPVEHDLLQAWACKNTPWPQPQHSWQQLQPMPHSPHPLLLVHYLPQRPLHPHHHLRLYLLLCLLRALLALQVQWLYAPACVPPADLC